MAVTKQEFDYWLEAGKEMGASHIISVCDSWDYSDFPVYVMPDEDLEITKEKYNGKNMLRINEIINLSMYNPITGEKI